MSGRLVYRQTGAMNILERKNGFTLLEVLIAVLIVGIGLMSTAGLMATSIKGNTLSRDGTIAVEMAQEMVDRVKTNAGNTPEVYNGINTSGTCGGLDPARGDCNQWKARLQSSGLINPVGTVTVSSDVPYDASAVPVGKWATVTVTLTWGAIPTASHQVTFTTIVSTWLT